MDAAQHAVVIESTAAWVGPTVTGGIAGVVDYAFPGKRSWVDRVAAIGYYACVLSFVHILGFAAWEQDLLDSDRRIFGSAAAFLAHVILVFALFGHLIPWCRGSGLGWAKFIGVNAARTPSASASARTGSPMPEGRINTRIVYCTSLAAALAPLAAGNVVWLTDAFANLTIGSYGAVSEWAIARLGGLG